MMAITPEGRERLDRARVANPQPGAAELPWGGRSPRTLTEAYIRFSLSQEASTLNEGLDDLMLDEQCRRHFHGS